MYHCSVKVLSRSGGRSAAGAAAYISASQSVDVYTEKSFDYGRKSAPVAVGFANTQARSAAEFGAALDGAEKRKDSCVAREVVLALPDSLPSPVRVQLTQQIADQIADRWGVPVMWAAHKPDRGGDQRNHHAHILFSTRDNSGKKTLALDKRETGVAEIDWLRGMVSERLQSAVPEAEREQWSHRSLAARGIERPATEHEGPMVRGIRRQGVSFGPAKHNDQVRALAEDISQNESYLHTLEQANAAAAIALAHAALARADATRAPARPSDEGARRSAGRGWACDSIARRIRAVAEKRRADRAEVRPVVAPVVDPRRASVGTGAGQAPAHDQRGFAPVGAGVAGASAPVARQNPAPPSTQKVMDERERRGGMMPMPQPKPAPVMVKPIRPFAHEAEREEECPLDGISRRTEESRAEMQSGLDMFAQQMAEKAKAAAEARAKAELKTVAEAKKLIKADMPTVFDAIAGREAPLLPSDKPKPKGPSMGMG